MSQQQAGVGALRRAGREAPSSPVRTMRIRRCWQQHSLMPEPSHVLSRSEVPSPASPASLLPDSAPVSSHRHSPSPSETAPPTWGAAVGERDSYLMLIRSYCQGGAFSPAKGCGSSRCSDTERTGYKLFALRGGKQQQWDRWACSRKA